VRIIFGSVHEVEAVGRRHCQGGCWRVFRGDVEFHCQGGCYRVVKTQRGCRVGRGLKIKKKN